MVKFRASLSALLVLGLALGACSKSRPVAEDEYHDYRTDGPERGKVGGDQGLVLGIGGKTGGTDAAGESSALGVNAYLWRAALDTLAFMPLASADPFGGVIITDWYSPPASQGERFKATAYILGRQLRADGIRVTIFRQVKRGGQWVDAPVSPVDPRRDRGQGPGPRPRTALADRLALDVPDTSPASSPPAGGQHRIRLPRGRTALAGSLGRAAMLPRRGRAARRQAEILRARDVPVSQRQDPHGPRPQLRARRRRRAVQAGARLRGHASRWAGTRSACRRRTPHATAASTPTPGPAPTSRRCAPNCSAWACRSTGRASSPPATRPITGTSRSCSSTC